MMKECIVVIGGYGHVGKTICRELAELYPGKVIAAGRSYERSKQFCLSTNGKVIPMQIDIREPIDPDLWNCAKLIIMCLDQADTSFVQACFENGTHYLDISASEAFLSQVGSLYRIASINHVTALLSIGLAPGLTNLLARQAKSLMDQTDDLEISIMLGLGDQHGRAAIEWTIDNLTARFDVVENARKKTVSSFTDGKSADFGATLGYRKAYRFNFSDQHFIPQTLGISTVSTRLCFDSAVMTSFLAWLKASGTFCLVRNRRVRDAIVQAFGKIRFGKELFALKIDAWGKKNGKDARVECLVQGENEAKITAKVATSVATIVYQSTLPHGVYHIEQLFELAHVMPSFEHLISIEMRVNVEP